MIETDFTPSDAATEITPLTLRPGKLKSVLLLLCSLLFVAGGIGLAISGDWIGYVGTAFFALGIPVFVIQLLPGGSYLRIEPDGFTVCSLYRKYYSPWLAVDKFFVIYIARTSIKKSKRVGYNWVQAHHQYALTLEISKALAGSEAMLPGTYGKKAEALANFMNECLLKARTKDRGGSVSESRPGHETEPIAVTHEKPRVGSGQVREINISGHSYMLRLLRTTDYALVILCGTWLIDALTRIGRLGVLDVLFIGFMCLCVYTGWRHAGVIDSRVWRTQIIVFPLLLLFCAAVLLSNISTRGAGAAGGGGRKITERVRPTLVSVCGPPRHYLAVISEHVPTRQPQANVVQAFIPLKEPENLPEV